MIVIDKNSIANCVHFELFLSPEFCCKVNDFVIEFSEFHAKCINQKVKTTAV